MKIKPGQRWREKGKAEPRLAEVASLSPGQTFVTLDILNANDIGCRTQTQMRRDSLLAYWQLETDK